MATKVKSPRERKPRTPKKSKVVLPKCAICLDKMQLKKVIPAAHIFPELRTFQCVGCGNLRTVEDVAELAIPETEKVAA
jgi:hypothetical protein